jgi:hypothetical protein
MLVILFVFYNFCLSIPKSLIIWFFPFVFVIKLSIIIIIHIFYLYFKLVPLYSLTILLSNLSHNLARLQVVILSISRQRFGFHLQLFFLWIVWSFITLNFWVIKSFEKAFSFTTELSDTFFVWPIAKLIEFL